jgi:hypothetical protein
MKRFASLAVSLLLVSGCAAAKLPPKASPEEVRVFMPNTGIVPEEGYKVIGPVRADGPPATPDADIVAKMRANAAKLGADALIVNVIRRSTEGASGGGLDERKIGEGLAIYWAKT